MGQMQKEQGDRAGAPADKVKSRDIFGAIGPECAEEACLPNCTGACPGSSSDRAERSAPAPASAPGTPFNPRSRPVTGAVRALLDERERRGIATYGVSLTTWNGRSSPRDLVEELIDAAQYALQWEMERADLMAEVERLKRSLGGDDRARTAELEGWKHNVALVYAASGALDRAGVPAPPPRTGARVDDLVTRIVMLVAERDRLKRRQRHDGAVGTP